MTTYKNNIQAQSQRRKHWARRSHRIIAISALFFLILLSVTGLLLNHADALGLSQRAASSALVSWLYGVEAPPIDAAFEAGGITFATAADTLYAGNTELAKNAGEIRGAVARHDLLVVATDRELFVLTKAASLIERAKSASHAELLAVGIDGDQFVVESDVGQLEFDPDSMAFSSPDRSSTDLRWSQPTALGAEQIQRLNRVIVGQSINWERILTDLHSGRILPVVGRYLADMAALCLLYLCMTGVVLWFRRR